MDEPAAIDSAGRAQPGGNIQALTAGRPSQGRGTTLFALDATGRLWINLQNDPGGGWIGWVGGGMGQPTPGQNIALAGQNDGALMLAMTDLTGMVWTFAETFNGWGEWSGPGVGGEEFSFASIAAGEQSGPRGIQLVGADAFGEIWACYQMNPGADWSGWTRGVGNNNGGDTFRIGEVALGGQNNGCLMLVAEAGGIIGVVPQVQPGGTWGDWSFPNEAGPPSLNGICACQQGGSRGVQLWGLDTAPATMGQIWTLFQDSAGGPWDAWQGPGFVNQPEPFLTIAASHQTNGCTILFGVGVTGNLWTIGQTSPGGGWGSWAQMKSPG